MEGGRYINRPVQDIVVNAREVNRKVGSTRASVTRPRANGMLHLERNLTNGQVTTVICNDFRVSDGRFGNFRFRRVQRDPYAQHCVTFCNVDRYVRANYDDRSFQRKVRRLQIGGDCYQGVVEICAGRLFFSLFIGSGVVSNRLDDDSHHDEWDGDESDLLADVHRAFRELRVYGVQVVRGGAGAFYHVGKETTARDRSGVNAKYLRDDRAVLCVNGNEVNLRVARRLVECAILLRGFGRFVDRLRASRVSIHCGRDLFRASTNDLRNGHFTATNARVENLVRCRSVRGCALSIGAVV